MIALVEFDQLVAGTIRSAVVGEVVEYDGLGALRQTIDADDRIQTVLLGPSVDQQAALDLASAYRTKRPELGVILIRRRLDTVIVTDAIRAGIRDVVADRDMTQLTKAVQRSQQVTAAMRSAGQEQEPSANRGRVITVFSAKGGCGKTTVSTNLATLLATRPGATVALVDLDLSFGDVAISMQITPSHSIADAVTMGDQLDATGVLQLLHHHKSGVHVLAAPPSPELAEKIDESLVHDILAVLASSYDYVVVDTPPAMDGPTLTAFDASDIVLLLTTLDIPSLKNTKLSLETLKVLGYPTGRIRLVLNRADSKVGLDPGDIEGTLGLPVVASLPSTRDVPASTNRGEVLAAVQPKHPFALALAGFADTAVVVETPASDPAAPAAKRRRSLWRKS
jgi:pilus assembly protein CpaE